MFAKPTQRTHTRDRELVTFEEIKKSREVVSSSGLCRVTPLLRDMEYLNISSKEKTIRLYLKLENMQVTGSFKVRGVACQFANLPKDVLQGRRTLVTMSGGNYGKAFAHTISKVCKEEGLSIKGLVLLPHTAPQSRIEVIRSFGVDTESVDVSCLQATADRYVREKDMVYKHPYDDKVLLAGYGSLGFEIIESCPNVDVVLVPCGGGGVLAGVAAALHHLRPQCRVYGVEPVGACVMHDSLKRGEPVALTQVRSIAAGLAAPFAGHISYCHCKAYVKDILLVTDDELINTMKILFDSSIVAEPAGCAGLAALLHDKLHLASGEHVVCVITGGNISPGEMDTLCKK